MKVLMVASEAAPFAKTGGLADVVGALPAALQALGDEVAVVLPRYAAVDLKSARRVYDSLPVWLPPRRYDTTIYQIEREIPFYLVDCPPLYDRKGLYGEAGVDYPDNHIRFAVLARAALAFAGACSGPIFCTATTGRRGWCRPTCAPLLPPTPPSSACARCSPSTTWATRGCFPRRRWRSRRSTGAVPPRRAGVFRARSAISRAASMLADALNTVSPTYAREIQTPEYGFGLDGALRARGGVLTGILNGVDYREWNPETDRLIAGPLLGATI